MSSIALQKYSDYKLVQENALRILFLASLWGVFLLCTLLTTFSFFEEHGWIFDLCSYFHTQYLFLSALVFFLSALSRQTILIFLSLVLVMINSFEILQVSSPSFSKRVSPEKELGNLSSAKVLVLNVLTVNSMYSPVIDYINQKDPDIIALLEINLRWLKALSKVLDTYPHRLHLPRQDNFGIGIFSKIALDNTHIKEFTWAKTPGIQADITLANHKLTLHLTHTVPPISPLYWGLRNEHLKELSMAIHTTENLQLVFGDLNLPPYSRFFRSFLERSGLQMGLSEMIPPGTWPTGLPFLFSPVDYVILDQRLSLLQWERGADMGSDHLPIFFEVGMEHTGQGESARRRKEM